MCDLITAVAVASQAVGFAGQVSEANAENARSMAANRDAGLAAGWKYSDEGKRYAYDAKNLQQEGYDLTIKARENMGAGIASAGSSGVGGLTLGALVSDSKQKAAENLSRIATKKDDARDSYIANTKSIEAQNKSVINSNPMNPGPSLLNLAIGVAEPIAESDWAAKTLKF
jgi:hypothetical protein